MQIGGVGGGHDGSSHRITNCMHDHGRKMEAPGGLMKSQSFGGGFATGTAQAGGTAQSFSLSAWLADPLGSAKKLVGVVWRGGHDSGDGTSGKETSGSEKVMAEIAADLTRDTLEKNSLSGSTVHGETQGQSAQQASPHVLHNPQIAAAATAVKPLDMLQGNPYFAVEDSSTQRQTIWQKMKVQFEAVAGYLTKRFAFSGKNSFQAKQEQPKEDLRKRSRYRGDKLDVECVLTDDSYLLDSYDRKGEYSQLSTRQ